MVEGVLGTDRQHFTEYLGIIVFFFPKPRKTAKQNKLAETLKYVDTLSLYRVKMTTILFFKK